VFRANRLLFLLVLAPAAVRAEPTPKQVETARALFAEAERLENRKDYARALDDLRKVAEVKLTPGVRFHIALCEQELGQWVQALDDFVAAEGQARKEGNEEVLAALKEPLIRLRARMPKISVAPPGIPDAIV
jgi:tetratricopeptide (TPR) repeat protein